MWNLGLAEIAVIVPIGLLIFGPGQAAEGHQDPVGMLQNLRSAASDASRSLQDAAGWDSTETRQTLSDLADLHPKRLMGSLLDEAEPKPAAKAGGPGYRSRYHCSEGRSQRLRTLRPPDRTLPLAWGGMTSPALASVDDPDKVRALRRMKVIALSLLIVAAIVCLYAWHMVESGGAPSGVHPGDGRGRHGRRPGRLVRGDRAVPPSVGAADPAHRVDPNKKDQLGDS